MSEATSRSSSAGAQPVLHVRIVSGAGGGPEKTILNSPRHLVGSPHPALVAYLHDPEQQGFERIRDLAREKQCPLFEIHDRRPLLDMRRVLRELSSLVREHGVRIWHAHDYKSNLIGVLLRRRHSLKLVTTVHGWVKHTRKTPFYYAIDRWTLPRHDAVLCVSEDLHQRCAALGVAPDKLWLVPNAIDTQEFSRRAPAASVALRADMPGGRILIGAVGRLSEEKGFELLIQAVERLVAEGLDLELWIAGEGDRRSALEAQIAASPCAARLRLLGFRSDTRELFEAFDLFCLSSLREGLPNVVLEAMALEVPVLATRCGGMQAFARDAEDALLCAPASVEALMDGLRRLATDVALRSSLARAARQRIEAEFSFEQRMRRVLDIYCGLKPTQ